MHTMKFSPRRFLLVLTLFLAGCGAPSPTIQPSPDLPPSLSTPIVVTTQAPDPEPAARAYLQAWNSEDYSRMYASLTEVSKDALTEEEFTARYRNIAAEAALSSIDTQILSALTQTRTAQVSYRVTLHSSLVGDLVRDTMMNLSLENGSWQVQWDEALILPELAGGNTLRMDYQIPSRANIYDRNGQALVAQADATALGLIPSQIDPDQETALLNELSRLTGMRPDTIQAMYENFPPGVDWYLGLREVSADAVQARENVLSGLAGLVMRPFRSRYYFDNGIAPHVIGYVTAIPLEQEEEYRRLGYRRDERVGQSGLEKWGEPYLSGKRGGALYVVDPSGLILTKLAESAPEPSQAIYTTLDKDLQLGAQQALAGLLGAIVVLERDTGRVLAMASSPGFDPNLFEPSNFNSGYLLQDLFNPDTVPLLNRATQGQYPLGSVFKIITMAAALESGLYTADTIYDCQHTFTELQGVTLYDWTFEKELPPSGTLTLPEGLMRSCNPYFYHIGRQLYVQGFTSTITEMARGFGLGEATGIEQVTEVTGQVPEPQSELDATNQSVGQGNMQVTPLQVASFIAAIGNGGTLYRPQVIESIAPPDGEATFTFSPEGRGELPISDQTLQTIQDAMVSVVEDRRGTAWHRFRGLNISIAGKTGTAQDPPRDPHAWFAGYTFEERENLPDIAVVVILENTGEGSEYAAPVFRRVLEVYFSGSPNTLYWWESDFGATRTPTPETTETPTPEP
jgi:penicillin-binding protein 2